MDLYTAICIILTNCMELLVHNLFSVLQIIITECTFGNQQSSSRCTIISNSVQDGAPRWAIFQSLPERMTTVYMGKLQM